MASRGWRTARGAGAFLDGFLNGQEIAGRIQKDWRDEEVRGQIAATDENFTPRQTEVAAGDEAFGAGMTALDNARASAVTGLTEGTPEYQAALDKVQDDYQPTLAGLRKDQSRPASVAYSMGVGGSFKQQQEPFSPGEIEGAKARERASIYQRAGREEDASRVLLNASRSRELSDQDAIRSAFATPADTAAKGIPMVSTNRAGTGLSEPMDAAALPAGVQDQMQARPGAGKPAGEDARLGAVKEGMSGPADRAGTDAYFQRKAPQIIDAYLKQGNLEGAKRYRDFIDSESGRAYVQDWSKGVRKLMIGDHNGAIATWQDLYNRQLYDDGNTVKLTPTEDGKQVQADFFDKAGQQVHSITKPIDAFAKQAGFAMAPENLVKCQAEQQAKRETEHGTLNRQIQLEQLRQEGADVRDDRREERLQTRLDVQSANLERRLSAGGGRGGLTAPQQRSNAEIDAAREAVAGMSPQEIARRTAKATNTGRENPDYDPGLARQAALAGRRKVGNDELFDSPKPKPAAPALDRAVVAKKFSADKAMSSYRLGPIDPKKGLPVVLDKSGKVVGHYN